MNWRWRCRKPASSRIITSTRSACGGKIFITVPPEGTHIHLFVPGRERETIPGLYPDLAEKLRWGKKVVGLRIGLENATRHDALLAELIGKAWRAKAPSALLRQYPD